MKSNTEAWVGGGPETEGGRGGAATGRKSEVAKSLPEGSQLWRDDNDSAENYERRKVWGEGSAEAETEWEKGGRW